MALRRGQGSSSASKAMVLAVALLVSLLLLHLETVGAATFTVGDSSGWNFFIGNWTDGKEFKAGDKLIFNYDPSVHDVVVVDKKGYDGCTSSSTSVTYSSGNDEIELKKGGNYFICSIPGHCNGGLKIAANAS